MGRIGVGRPVLRKAVGLMAVRSLREVVAMPEGVRVRDHKRAVGCLRIVGRRSFCRECLTTDAQAANRSDYADYQLRALEFL